MSIPNDLRGSHKGCGGELVYRPVASRRELLAGNTVRLVAACGSCGESVPIGYSLAKGVVNPPAVARQRELLRTASAGGSFAVAVADSDVDEVASSERRSNLHLVEEAVNEDHMEDLEDAEDGADDALATAEDAETDGEVDESVSEAFDRAQRSLAEPADSFQPRDTEVDERLKALSDRCERAKAALRQVSEELPQVIADAADEWIHAPEAVEVVEGQEPVPADLATVDVSQAENQGLNDLIQLSDVDEVPNLISDMVQGDVTTITDEQVVSVEVPEVAEPATVEPVLLEPVLSEPAVVEPAVLDPVPAEPVVSEPVSEAATEPAPVMYDATVPMSSDSEMDACKRAAQHALAMLPPPEIPADVIEPGGPGSEEELSQEEVFTAPPIAVMETQPPEIPVAPAPSAELPPIAIEAIEIESLQETALTPVSTEQTVEPPMPMPMPVPAPQQVESTVGIAPEAAPAPVSSAAYSAPTEVPSAPSAPVESLPAVTMSVPAPPQQAEPGIQIPPHLVSAPAPAPAPVPVSESTPAPASAPVPVAAETVISDPNDVFAMQPPQLPVAPDVAMSLAPEPSTTLHPPVSGDLGGSTMPANLVPGSISPGAIAPVDQMPSTTDHPVESRGFGWENTGPGFEGFEALDDKKTSGKEKALRVVLLVVMAVLVGGGGWLIYNSLSGPSEETPASTDKQIEKIQQDLGAGNKQGGQQGGAGGNNAPASNATHDEAPVDKPVTVNGDGKATNAGKDAAPTKNAGAKQSEENPFENME